MVDLAHVEMLVLGKLTAHGLECLWCARDPAVDGWVFLAQYAANSFVEATITGEQIRALRNEAAVASYLASKLFPAVRALQFEPDPIKALHAQLDFTRRERDEWKEKAESLKRAYDMLAPSRDECGQRAIRYADELQTLKDDARRQEDYASALCQYINSALEYLGPTQAKRFQRLYRRDFNRIKALEPRWSHE